MRVLYFGVCKMIKTDKELKKIFRLINEISIFLLSKYLVTLRRYIGPLLKPNVCKSETN